ncbi:hypothetical protein JXC34_06915 [Candidatus Woesearchaeota archaeon]|nr:hypothetical protein [Candidatus Woesearchaeota archaeon]
MKILIVDNNLHIKAYPQGFMVRSRLGLKNMLDTYVRKPHQLKKKDCAVDKVILTGSMAYIREEKQWMKKECEFISAWMKKGIPILGICFGAQILAYHIFGKKSVSRMPVQISGSILFRKTKNVPLFRGLPDEFGVVTTHYDGITAPEKYKIGETEEWPDYAFHYPGNIYGIQFHPELMGPLGRSLVRIQKLVYDRNVYQDFSVQSNPEYGKRIYRNFINERIG